MRLARRLLPRSQHFRQFGVRLRGDNRTVVHMKRGVLPNRLDDQRGQPSPYGLPNPSGIRWRLARADLATRRSRLVNQGAVGRPACRKHCFVVSLPFVINSARVGTPV